MVDLECKRDILWLVNAEEKLVRFSDLVWDGLSLVYDFFDFHLLDVGNWHLNHFDIPNVVREALIENGFDLHAEFLLIQLRHLYNGRKLRQLVGIQQNNSLPASAKIIVENLELFVQCFQNPD